MSPHLTRPSPIGPRSSDVRLAVSMLRRMAVPIATALLLLAGCATQPPETPQRGPERTPAQVRAEIQRLLPHQAPDREGWARDIATAFSAQALSATTGHLCAVIAVIEQESSFQADPAVPGLPGIARREIERRAQALHVPTFLITSTLNLESPGGKTYNQRLDTVRTERQLSAIFEDFIGMVPMGQRLFSGLNPVHTGGPMQVSIAFAEQHAADYPYPIPDSIRREVFTRRGGVYFGVAHLLGYPVHYDSVLYRFADFNAGWYASRNAAFQAAVSRVSGITLALDGDLVIPGSGTPGQTEQAVRTLRRKLDINEAAIHPALDKGETLDFETTPLYRKVFALADADAGKPVPRAVLPGITLESPKITRTLTTAWFANRVHERWKRCIARAGI